MYYSTSSLFKLDYKLSQKRQKVKDTFCHNNSSENNNHKMSQLFTFHFMNEIHEIL